MEQILEQLLSDPDPCLRYQVRRRLLQEDINTPAMHSLAEEVKTSARLQSLLKFRQASGELPGSPYAKFTGAHWVLAVLADIDYPGGDQALLPLRDQVYACWLDPQQLADRVVERQASRYKSQPGVPWIQGRARRCASQQGNALWSTLKLGLAEDERSSLLASKLIEWQWQDGGWNCDRKPSAIHSSFHESLIPLRALNLYARLSGNETAHEAAQRAADIFLKRRLFKRLRDGEIMHADFTLLHYPCYWHYDILFGLKVLAEAGLVNDPRCSDALDLLEAKRLPDGGFPAERKFYRVVTQPQNGGSLVDWGGSSKRRMNPWVTIDALFVLQSAGRLDSF